MWYLATDKQSKKHYIKIIDGHNVYIADTNYNNITKTPITEIQIQGVCIIGLAHEFENAKLEMLLKDKLKE